MLRPVSEVLLDDEAIRRFRQRYREQFGATGNDDPLYESVSAGRRHVGMEHWLPLYYEQLETVFDYLPDAGVSFDHQAEDVFHHRLEQITEFYAARRTAAGVGAQRRTGLSPAAARAALSRQSRMGPRAARPAGGAALALRRDRSGRRDV